MTWTSVLRRSLPLVLLVLGVSAVVAMTTNGVRLLPAPAELGEGWAWGVRIGAGFAIAAGIIGLLLHRRRLGKDTLRGPDPTAAGLRTAAITMGLLVALALLFAPPAPSEDTSDSPTPRLSRDESPPERDASRVAVPSEPERGRGGMLGSGGSGGGGSRGPMVPGYIVGPQPSLVRSLGGGLPLLLLLFVLLIGLRLLKRRGRLEKGEGGPPDLPLEPEKARSALEASLAEIDGDSPDPRVRITAAYYRLLVALAEAGVPRMPQEAPHEHLRRTLGPLGVHPQPLHRLTELYVMAQFSARAVTDRHCLSAAEALEVSLETIGKAPRAGRGAEGGSTAGLDKGLRVAGPFAFDPAGGEAVR